MINPIKLLVRVFYVYYSNSRSSASIAYESAVLTVGWFIFMHVSTVLNFFGIEYFWITPESDSLPLKWIKWFAIVVLPTTGLSILMCPKKEVEHLEIDNEIVSGARSFLVLYVTLSAFIWFVSTRM
jgi:hypothetical protein